MDLCGRHLWIWCGALPVKLLKGTEACKRGRADPEHALRPGPPDSAKELALPVQAQTWSTLEEGPCDEGEPKPRTEALVDIPIKVAGVSVRQILQEEAANSRTCGPKQCFLGLLLIVILGGMAYLLNTQQDNLTRLSKIISRLGFVGHVVFFVLFIWTGLPCGYGYSTVIVLVGFSYGWMGLIDSNIGTLVSAYLGYRCGHCCCGRWTQEWLKSLSGRKRLYLEASKILIESEKAGVLMQVVLRLQPLLTFGLLNAFLGAYCTIPLRRYLLTSFVGTQQSIIMMTAIGVLIHNVGSLEAAMESPEGRVNLIINIGVFWLMAIGGVAYVRYLTVHVLPYMVSDDAMIESPSNDSAKPAGPRNKDGECAAQA